MGKMASLAEILESEQLISRFFEASHVGLAVLDNRLRYRMLNPYLAASHNAPAECHLGKHLREILGSVAAPVETAIDRVFLNGRAIVNCEIEGALPTRPDGGRWIANYFPISDSSGKVAEVGAVVVELGKEVECQLSIEGAAQTVIRSWKDIAQYVGTSVKTVQRWERALEFPVRRVNPSRGSIVFAFQNEIEDWLRKRALSNQLAHRERTHPRRG